MQALSSSNVTRAAAPARPRGQARMQQRPARAVAAAAAQQQVAQQPQPLQRLGAALGAAALSASLLLAPVAPAQAAASVRPPLARMPHPMAACTPRMRPHAHTQWI